MVALEVNMDENYLDSLLNGVSADKETGNDVDTEVNKDSGVDIDKKDLDGISLDELDDLDNLDLGELDLDDIDFDDVDVTSMSAQKAADNKEDEEDFSLDGLLEAENNTKSDDNTDYPSPADTINQDNIDNMDIDDLFTALGIDGSDRSQDDQSDAAAEVKDSNAATGNDFSNGVESQDDFIPEGMEDILDVSQVDSAAGRKKTQGGSKKNLSTILFGEPDEDDREEEALYQQKKAKKAENKEKRRLEAEKKKAEKSAAARKKQSDNKAREQLKLKKKKERDAAIAASLEDSGDEKKVSNGVVVTIFLIFAALLTVVVLGTKEFDYRQVIRKAEEYFDRDRYSLAYDEVVGVQVKEDDEELRDRIYTVMYVERLYESYENNMLVGRRDKALDALLRGLEKYDVHYKEAVELNIVEDIDVCKSKIIAALKTCFGLSEDEARQIMTLEGQEYVQALLMYSENANVGE